MTSEAHTTQLRRLICLPLVIASLTGCAGLPAERGAQHKEGFGCFITSLAGTGERPSKFALSASHGLAVRFSQQGSTDFGVISFLPKAFGQVGFEYQDATSHGLVSPRFVPPGTYELHTFQPSQNSFLGGRWRYQTDPRDRIQFQVSEGACTYIGRFVLTGGRILWQSKLSADLAVATAGIPSSFRQLPIKTIIPRAVGTSIELE